MNPIIIFVEANSMCVKQLALDETRSDSTLSTVTQTNIQTYIKTLR